MATPTTFRAEIEKNGLPVNRRQILLVRGTSAGTNPQNPVQRGVGLTFELRTRTDVATVTARMVYMPDEGETKSRAVTFIEDTAGRWLASGAAGGPTLGFPDQPLAYGVSQPFELEVTVFFRGGRDVQRYALWVGDSDAYFLDDCDTRQNFNIILKNCCYNAQGFRSAANQELFNSFVGGGDGGEWDTIFDAGMEPAGYEAASFAFGLPNSNLAKACVPDRALVNYVIPDWVTGLSLGYPDNPFITPVRPYVVGDLPYDNLSTRERLDPVLDKTAADLGIYCGGSARPAPPWYPTPPNVYVPWPDFRHSLGPMHATPVVERPHSRRLQPTTVKDVTTFAPRLRGQLQVLWGPNAQALPGSTGLPYEESAEAIYPTDSPAAPPTTLPILQFTIAGMDPGETVFFFVCNNYPQYLIQIPLMTNALDTLASDFTRRVSGAGPGGNHKLLSGLGGTLNFGAGGSPDFHLLVRAVSGTSRWFFDRIGGFATIGSSGALTFVLPADTDYLRASVDGNILVQHEDQPDAAITLYFQGVVCRPGTFPRPTLSSDPWGVDFPHSAWLTSIARLRLRRR